MNRKGKFVAKIHTSCNALGNSAAFHLTESQVHDRQDADVLFPELPKRIDRCTFR